LKSEVIRNSYCNKGYLNNPRESTIFSLIRNFVLDGLEEAVKKSLSSAVSSKNGVLYTSRVLGKFLKKGLNVHFIRYADNFIITGCSKQMIKKYIKPAIGNFLHQRGLRLSSSKTKIYRLIERPIQFLGYDFIFKKNWQQFQVNCKKENYQSDIVLIPGKENFLNFLRKLKRLIKASTHLTAAVIIEKLNPVIRDWCSYFYLGQSYKYRKILEKYLFQLC
jgi:RNA-directed DNA polymerase